MVGGIVLETIHVPEKGRVWINCEERGTNDKCAIYVKDDAKARCVSPGDIVWWQGRRAMWTPYNSTKDKQGRNFDILLERIGYSGVPKP